MVGDVGRCVQVGCCQRPGHRAGLSLRWSENLPVKRHVRVWAFAVTVWDMFRDPWPGPVHVQAVGLSGSRRSRAASSVGGDSSGA
eukprot:3511432-Rhodomonas_salina.1